jgi:hypothetical protein
MNRAIIAAVAAAVLTGVFAKAMIHPARYSVKPTEAIMLTSRDVQTNSVELFNQLNTNGLQNLEVRLVGKTSDEIKVMCENAYEVQIVKDGIIVTKTDRGFCGVTDETHTNYLALDLLFSKYDQARLAEKTLRGE